MWSVPSTLTAALLLTAPLLLLLAGLAPTAWANRRPRTMAGLSGIECRRPVPEALNTVEVWNPIGAA